MLSIEALGITYQVMQLVEKERNLLKLFSSINAEEETLKTLKGDLHTLELAVDPSTQIILYRDFQEWLLSDSPKFPSEEDLDGAALGLLRLQEIYKFYPEDITRGMPFSMEDAIHVGVVAYQHDKFQHAFH
ncbi:hypothetical protein IRJ41_002313 [Triplophysa rosa]|uniref:Prolyl 4-hydroxylase N-terminal domain-containing protein n=1 Tax=Triplophysa rosa TaxID=992332 RepID=A0A9W8C763_TRIRA|nr:hypothetical protein IRJ41_002313 [Triplophysa rosa]